MAIPAKFRGVCGECDQTIDLDEMIEQRRPSLDWVHVSCPDVEPKPTKFQGTTLEEMGF
jgi:hypothetical protein